jgi:hypothetical protein
MMSCSNVENSVKARGIDCCSVSDNGECVGDIQIATDGCVFTCTGNRKRIGFWTQHDRVFPRCDIGFLDRRPQRAVAAAIVADSVTNVAVGSVESCGDIDLADVGDVDFEGA